MTTSEHEPPPPGTNDRARQGVERIAIVGMGAMGKRLAMSLRARNDIPFELCCLVSPNEPDVDLLARTFGVRVFRELEALTAWRPTLAVECAGHAAVEQVIVPLLARGVDVILVSVGALCSATLRARIDHAMESGASGLTLVSGAIGGLDALSAASMGGLDSVEYTGRKPPRAWLGSPAENQFDLLSVDQPTVIFDGTADESARLYPKNANVTAAVALAGAGFEKTRVKMMADPGVDRNVHEIDAQGAFGHLTIRIENNPLPDNPRTSWLAAMSIEDAVVRRLEHSIWK